MLRTMIRRERILTGVAIGGVATCLTPLVLFAVPFLDHPSGPAAYLLLSIPLAAIGGAVGAFIFLTLRCDSPKTRRWLQYHLEPHGNVDGVIDRIDQDLAAGDVYCAGRLPWLPRSGQHPTVIVTRSWLLSFDSSGFCLLRLDDIFWAYKAIVVVPTLIGGRLSFQIGIASATEYLHFLRVVDEPGANDVLNQLVRRRPYIFVGYQVSCRDVADKGVNAMRAATGHRKQEWAEMSEDEREDCLGDRLDEARRYVSRHDPQLRVSEGRSFFRHD